MKRSLVVAIKLFTVFSFGFAWGNETLVNGSEHESKQELVKYFFELFEDNDAVAISKVLSSSYTLTNASNFSDMSFRRYAEMSNNIHVRMKAIHRALPELTIHLDEILVDQNKVMVSLTLSGIHKGPLFGINATGKPIHMKCVSILTIEEGKIAHMQEMWNDLSIMKQLGFTPV